MIAPVKISLVAVLGVFAGIISLSGQTPDEHAAHHPGQAQTPPSGGKAGQAAGRQNSGMGGEMERMMQQMLNPPPKELYPTLMSLPELPPAKRAEIQRQAHDRMIAGTKSMSQWLAKMAPLVERKDYKALQEATEQMRQGLAQFESGLAAHRALSEGRAPPSIALEWFKNEMNLLPTAVPTVPAPSAPSWFHPFVMTLLTGFAVVMIGMYFFKMRRAAALLGALREQTPTSAAPVSALVASAPAALLSHGPPVPAKPWSGELRVARIFEETPEVKTFRLAPFTGDHVPFSFEPGQFLTVGVLIDGKAMKRSYSIASSPCCQGWCDITVKQAPGGQVSGYLHARVKEGDRLAVSGPWGRFTFRGHEAPSVVFIAGGVGITPLMSSIRYLTDQSWPGRIDLIYACARASSIIFREELDYLGRRHPNLHITITLDQEDSPAWTGKRGHLTKELLVETVPDLKTRPVHLCGPPPMMEAIKGLLEELGVPGDQVKTELFIAPEPQPAERIAAPAKSAAVCMFTRSNKPAAVQPGQTVLEVAENAGVNIEYSCRQGFCGECKVKLLAGSVTMAVQDALTPEDKMQHIILACQAIPEEDISIEA